MIKLRKIEILVNEEFANEKEYLEFKTGVTSDVARRMKHPPTVYNTFETHENALIINNN